MNKNYYKWLNIPNGIAGINYSIFDEVRANYSKVDELIKNIGSIILEYKSILNKPQTVRDRVDEDTNYTHLLPPYIIPCSYSTINKCSKKAAFKNEANSKYYCWFHVHCPL